MIGRVLKQLAGLSLAVLLIIPSGYVFAVGNERLVFWLMAREPDRYAVAYPYLWDAVPWTALGLLGLIGSLAVMTSRRRSWRWLWFPAGTLLYCLLVPLQPSYGWFLHRAEHPMSSQPIAWARDVTRHDFLRITGEWTVQAEARGEFSCPGGDLKVPSPFMSNGQILVYEVRCVERALHKAINPPTRPAIIVMSISEDRQEAWFQVTTLIHNAGETITWVSNYGGQEFVIHRFITDASESSRRVTKMSDPKMRQETPTHQAKSTKTTSGLGMA